ncbi:MAG TPA: rod shape-determining protein MreC [Candidatus Paceibacterota bacterium]|nr:rod shape-determining protein MreC [Candidatus Paceibacterota bacterium]
MFATALSVAALLIVFSINHFFPAAFPSVLFPVASGFWRAESATVGWFVSMAEIVQSKYSLVTENRKLSAEIAAQNRSMLLLSALQSENDALLRDLGRAAKGDYVLGAIMARPPVSPYDTLILDIGSSDGVAVGDKVYAEGDVLVGDVSDVFSGTSKVSLFSTPGRTMSVLVGSSTVATEATGKGGGNFVLTLPATTPLATGALVRLPGVKPHTFGIVDRIIVDSTDSLQTVLFRSPVNLSQLEFVEVDRTPHK